MLGSIKRRESSSKIFWDDYFEKATTDSTGPQLGSDVSSLSLRESNTVTDSSSLRQHSTNLESSSLRRYNTSNCQQYGSHQIRMPEHPPDGSYVGVTCNDRTQWPHPVSFGSAENYVHQRDSPMTRDPLQLPADTPDESTEGIDVVRESPDHDDTGKNVDASNVPLASNTALPTATSLHIRTPSVSADLDMDARQVLDTCESRVQHMREGYSAWQTRDTTARKFRRALKFADQLEDAIRYVRNACDTHIEKLGDDKNGDVTLFRLTNLYEELQRMYAHVEMIEDRRFAVYKHGQEATHEDKTVLERPV